MMLEPGCNAGNSISPMPASGPEFIQRRSLAILVRLTASTRNCPESSTAASWLLRRLELVVRRGESNAGLFAQQHGNFLTELGMCIDTRANSRAALRKCAQALHRIAESFTGVIDLRTPAIEFLADRDRHRIHQVRPTGLDNVSPVSAPFSRASSTGAAAPAATCP